MKIALVGIGGYGEVYLAALLAKSTPGLQFVAGVDPAAERCTRLAQVKAANVPIFPSLATMYTAGIVPDLAVIASPLQLHAEQSIYAMEHGSHVLVEKPITASLDELERMIAVRDRTGRHLAVGFQWAYSSGVQRLKRDIIAGRFGKPLRMKTRVYWPRDSVYYGRNGWAGRLRTPDGRAVLDSPVNNACAHFLQNMLFLLGPSENVSDFPSEVAAELYRVNPIENYDTAILRCTTQRGVELFAALSHATQTTVEPEFEFTFDRGVVWSGSATGYRIYSRTDAGEEVDYGPQPMGGDVGKLPETVAAIAARRPPICSAEAAAAHVALTLAVQQSCDPSDVPADTVEVKNFPNGRAARFMRGLDATLDRCYATAKLPRELNIIWASTSTPISALTGLSFPHRSRPTAYIAPAVTAPALSAIPG
ncbi:MAG: Gfo/Idh/MocA family oxidoreductase [Tepidisphaeraceae bacterium]